MIDVLTFGEAMLRLSVPVGQTLETAPAFDVHVAGAEANVASSLSRLGRRVSWVSALPEGPLGRRILTEMQGAGVDCSGVVIAPEGRIGTYFVELRPEPLPAKVIYDRSGSVAATFGLEDVDWEPFEMARIVHISGITPALSSTCLETALEIAGRAREGNSLLSIDVNYRSKLWAPSEAATAMSQMMASADIVVCTLEDAHDLFNLSGHPTKVVRDLAESFDIAGTIVTSGADGAWLHEAGTIDHVPALEVSVVDRIGAGDAFMAGVLDGILDDSLVDGVRRGTALAAMALSTRGDRPFVLRPELDALLEKRGRRVDR